MNLLSLFSFLNFICFVFTLMYLLRLRSRSGEVKAFFLTNLSLTIWTFAYTFFYVAADKETAWIWHKIGIVGGLGFPCFSVLYYFQITKVYDKLKPALRYIMFGILPLILLCINIVAPTTFCAQDLIKSTSGLGWTYVNSVTSVLYWLYLIYVLSYFGVGFYYVRIWGRQTRVKQYKKQSRILVYLFGMVLFFGLITDFILPLFSVVIPPLANILLFFVFFGDWLIFDRYSFYSATPKSNSHIILNTITDAVVMINGQGEIVRVNKAFKEMFGYHEKDVINKDSTFIFLDHKMVQVYLEVLLKEKTLKNIESEVITADKRILHTIWSASIAEDNANSFLGIVLSFHDITERKNMEKMWLEEKEKYKELARDYNNLANYDVLTGLPNRRMIFEKIKTLQNLSTDGQPHFALIYMDLNGFKKINDQYGHDTGDIILVETSSRLCKCLEEEDMLARLGGDEFVMMLQNEQTDVLVEDRINCIKNQFIEPIMINGHPYMISIAAGYAIYPGDADSIEELFHNADKAMYQDKNTVTKSDS